MTAGWMGMWALDSERPLSPTPHPSLPSQGALSEFSKLSATVPPHVQTGDWFKGGDHKHSDHRSSNNNISIRIILVIITT